MEQISLNYRR
uniref:Uncharacterized protein n=1 Tax=Anguilla anguilla TaxID=7936 RepID=A0A0E9P7D7_ANGAN